MSRGLGRIERRILDHLLKNPGWVSLDDLAPGRRVRGNESWPQDEFVEYVKTLPRDRWEDACATYGRLASRSYWRRGPGYDSIKRACRRLEMKGYLEHTYQGRRKHIRLSVPNDNHKLNVYYKRFGFRSREGYMRYLQENGNLILYPGKGHIDIRDSRKGHLG